MKECDPDRAAAVRQIADILAGAYLRPPFLIRFREGVT
jgi:hypothetical protein